MPTVFISEISWVPGRLSPETWAVAQRGPAGPSGTERDRAQASTSVQGSLVLAAGSQRGHWSLWILFWRLLARLWADLLGVGSGVQVAGLSLLRGLARPPGSACERTGGNRRDVLGHPASLQGGKPGPMSCDLLRIQQRGGKGPEDLGKGGQTDGHLIPGLPLLGCGATWVPGTTLLALPG